MKRFAKRLIRAPSSRVFPAKALDPGEMREIWSEARVCCVVSASGIGDSLMATPLIEALRRYKPDARLIVISSEKTAPVFKRNPHINTILTYVAEKHDVLGFPNLLSRLVATRIDVLFGAQPSNTIRHSLIAGFSGARLRLKHTYDYGAAHERDFSFLYHAQLPDSMARHRVELNLDFLRLLGEDIETGSIYPMYCVGNEAERRVEEWLISYRQNNSSDELLALHPGGVRENKRWKPEHFAELGKKLINMGFSVCLVGGEEEKVLCNSIAERIDTRGVPNAAGMFSLEQTAALLSRCQCLISNDTGIMHLATAIDLPVVAIFGPTDFRHIGPYSNKAKVVCQSSNIQDVSPSDVVDAIFQLAKVKPQPFSLQDPAIGETHRVLPR